jgi:hypothetical protein
MARISWWTRSAELKSGSRSGWLQIVRKVKGQYGRRDIGKVILASARKNIRSSMATTDVARPVWTVTGWAQVQ